MNDMPPSFANAMAMVSFETDCMMADANGTLRLSVGSSPFLHFTSGVLRLTLSGMHSSLV